MTTIIALSFGTIVAIASLATFKKDYKLAAKFAAGAIAAIYLISWITNL